MAGLVLLWLVMEAVCLALVEAHVALFSDNSPTVGWIRRLVSKHSCVAAQLLRALALRLKKKKATPLTPMHDSGTQNAMTDVPSRYFGSNSKWYCKTDADLLALYNKMFPLPNQRSWTVFHLTSAIGMRVICVLRMQPSTLEEWRRLPKIGKNIGTIGVATAHMWEWTLRYRLPCISNESDPSRVFRVELEVERLVEDENSKLTQCVVQSQPLARRSLWTME